MLDFPKLSCFSDRTPLRYWGCYFLTLCFLVSPKLTCKDIITLFDECVLYGYIRQDAYVVKHLKILEHVVKYCDSKQLTCKIKLLNGLNKVEYSSEVGLIHCVQNNHDHGYHFYIPKVYDSVFQLDYPYSDWTFNKSVNYFNGTIVIKPDV